MYDVSDAQRVLLSIKVKPESKAALARVAQEMSLTLSEVARMALSKGLAAIESERNYRRK